MTHSAPSGERAGSCAGRDQPPQLRLTGRTGFIGNAVLAPVLRLVLRTQPRSAEGASRFDTPARGVLRWGVELRGKKLGVLISCQPGEPGFHHGLRVAGAAMRRGVNVYLYCIDEAVMGVADAELQQLKAAGLNLYACAYGAHRRHLPLSDAATFAGLTVVNDIIVGTDRFVSFN